ncbi:hypothetical protein GCM10009613_04430 [Pseudonocardia kongjuensis]|uniref:Uncharacterized protein n=1 Tax=Pseudonocardia kongjuensis TaxID=102227 RepID=A0ABN1XH68_9PSEU
MLFVPVLDQVAARIGGVPVGARTDPARWAYRVRDAAALARPDWVVTHHDPQAEADAVRAAGGDPLDRPLPGSAAVAPLLELTRVLAGLFPRTAVAASLTGPVALARALAGGGTPDPELVTDCADALAGLASAQVEAGATRLLVWESDEPGPAPADALAPLLRRAAILGTPVLLRGGPVPATAGVLRARPDGSGDALLVDPAVFAPDGTAAGFERAWSSWTGASAPELVLTDGPVPYDCDLATVRAAGERPM